MNRIAAVLACCLANLLAAQALPVGAQPPVNNDPLEEPLPNGAIARFGTGRFRPGSHGGGRLTISRDGRRLVCSGWGGVTVWSVATGQLLQRIPARPLADAVEITPDGDYVVLNDYVASGSIGTSLLKVFEVATGKTVQIIEGAKTLASFALAPDGKTLALEYYAVDKKLGPNDFVYKTHLELRSFQTGKIVHVFGEDSTTTPMENLLFSTDGKSLFVISSGMNRTGKEKSTVRHFDVATVQLKAQFQIENVYFGSRLIQTGELLAIGNKIWNLTNGQLQTALGNDEYWRDGKHVFGLMPDQKTAVVAIPARNEALPGPESTIRRIPGRLILWDIVADKEIRPLPDHWGGYITPDGKSSFTVSMGGAIHHWDLASGKERLELNGSDSVARTLAFSSDQKWLARIDWITDGFQFNRHVSLWEVATGKRVHQHFIDEIPRITGLQQFTPDSKMFLLGGIDAVHTLDAATGQLGKRKLDGLGIKSDAADSMHCQLSPDGKSLALCFSNFRVGPAVSSISLLDWTSGRKIGELKSKEVVTGAFPSAYSHDGKQFAAVLYPPALRPVMDDKGNVVPKPLPIQLWNVTDRKATMIIPTGEVYLSFLQFGPGGSTLIGRFFNGKVYIWDTATGEEKLHFQPPMHQPTNFYTAISANGKFMATGDQDSNVVRFWDMQTGKQLAEFAGSPGIVSSLAFAPDSNLVAVGASNTTVLLVDVRKVLAKK